MNLTKMLIDVVNHAWQDGILTSLLVIFYLFFKQHIVPEAEKRHKNKFLTSDLNVAERFAGLIIPEVAKMGALSNADRKKEAVRFVSLQLLDHGIHLNKDTIDCTVEKIYQYMKGMGHLDVDKPSKTPDPTQMTPQQISNLTPSDVNNGGDNNVQNRK